MLLFLGMGWGFAPPCLCLWVGVWVGIVRDGVVPGWVELQVCLTVAQMSPVSVLSGWGLQGEATMGSPNGGIKNKTAQNWEQAVVNVPVWFV